MAERAWADLPELLLWMINGRVDMIGRLMLSLVCKHWRDASRACPTKFKRSAANTEPWVMAKTGNANERVFIKFSINGKSSRHEFKFSHGDLEGATFHSSKNGWLLFSRRAEDKTNLSYSVFLVNPVTRATIEMPLYSPARSSRIKSADATFSIIDGLPHRVVVVESVYLCGNTIAVATALVDKTWTHFPHQGKVIYFGDINIVDGKLVVPHQSRLPFCDLTLVANRWVVTYHQDDDDHGIFYFDLSKLVWVRDSTLQIYRAADTEWPIDKFWHVEFKGDLFIVVANSDLCTKGGTFECYKMAWQERAWVQVNEAELRGVCFYYDHLRVFMTRGEKQELYDINRLESLNDPVRPCVLLASWSAQVKSQCVQREMPRLSDAYFVELG